MFRVLKPPKQFLDPVLFRNSELKEDIRSKIIDEAYMFADELGLTSEQILGIYIIGSSITYNWYPEADIDINVLVDWDKPPKLMGPTYLEAEYQGIGKVEKPITYYFTNDLGIHTKALYDVIENKFMVEPVPMSEEAHDYVDYIAKKWLEKVSSLIGELKLDIYSYKTAKTHYNIVLSYGNSEQIKTAERDIEKAQSEIEIDIQLLRLNYKILATFRGVLTNKEFTTGIGNIVYKAIEYSSYKETIKIISETYKEFKKGEITFDELIEKIEEII